MALGWPSANRAFLTASGGRSTPTQRPREPRSRRRRHGLRQRHGRNACTTNSRLTTKGRVASTKYIWGFLYNNKGVSCAWYNGAGWNIKKTNGFSYLLSAGLQPPNATSVAITTTANKDPGSEARRGWPPVWHRNIGRRFPALLQR